MRQNLTNIKEVNIEDVEHFYVVGSTTKEGLIEGRSNVKLDLKKVGNGEGEDSSEDSALVKALFGQTPYAVVMPEEQSGDPLPVVTFEEALRTAGDDTTINIVYKEKEPKGKYMRADVEGGDTTIGAEFVGPNPSVMVKMPQSVLQGGPWYCPTRGDVDLTGFSVPELGRDPVALIGVEIPNKDEITIVYIGDGNFPNSRTLSKVSDEEFRASNDVLTKGSDGVWLWWRIIV